MEGEALYLKALGYHVYLATTNNAYCLDGKNFEANTKALHALKSTLNDDYLSRISNFDSTFVVWNTLTSLGEKDLYYAGSDSDVGSNTSNMCYMVQGDDPLEVNFEFELEEDIDMPYDELASLYQKLLEKYELLKKEKDSFKNKLSIISKENEFLKNQVNLISKEKRLFKGK